MALLVVAALVAVDALVAVGAPVAAGQEPLSAGARQKKATPKDESLQYDGKSFQDWAGVLKKELKPERLIEAVNAMSVFGRNGYGNEATEALVRFGAKYVPPSRSSWLERDKVMKATVEAFKELGERAIPVLFEALASEEASQREVAVVGLTAQWPYSKKVEERLVDATTDKDARVRRCAVSALSHPSDVAAARATLKKALKDQDVQVRRIAFTRIFQSLRTANAEQFEVAMALAKDPDPFLRRSAAEFVYQHGGDVQALVKLQIGLFVAATSVKEKVAVVTLLGNIGRSAKDALPLLSEVAVAPESPEVLREAAQHAAERIGGRAFFGKKKAGG